MSDNIRKKMFKEHREASLEREFYNAQAYDKAVLTLSTAALGFSFAFLKVLENPQCVTLIMFSWGCFFFAIISILLSFWTGNKAIYANIDNAREYYLEENEDALDKPCKYTKRNTYLNNASGILFVAGVLLFGIFAGYNI